MINWIRGLLFYIILAVTLVPLTIMMLLAYPLPQPFRYKLGSSWGEFMLYVGRWVCGMRWDEKGMENLPPPSTPVVVLCKHQSAWECFWLISRLPNRASFVYKRELHKVPVFGQALASVEMMAIDRSQGGRAFVQVMKQGRRFLKNGWWIAMFPEGTRTTPGCEPAYKTGGTRFAIGNKVPIVPIALNSGEVWPRNSIGKKPGLITVSVGPMIQTEGREMEEVQAELINWIEGEMHQISPEVYANSKPLPLSEEETPRA